MGVVCICYIEIPEGHPTSRTPTPFQFLFVNNSKIKQDNTDISYLVIMCGALPGRVTEEVSFISSP